MRKITALMLLLLGTVFTQFASAQTREIRQGSKEYELFAEAGHSVSGGTRDVNVFNAGFRFGYGLFSMGRHSWRGTVEYAIEGIPLYVVAQPGPNGFGASITPFDIKYNFTAPRSVTPFLELGGGLLFTNNDVPAGTGRVNFMPQAAFGVHVPLAARGNHLTFALKYVHISNAGLSSPNPGINTIQFKIGVGKFR